MMISKMSDKAILKELGLRISRYRLNKNMTQKTFAIEAGVSKATIQRAESGMSVQELSLIRILRVLKLLNNIEALIPEPAESPLQQLEMKRRKRRRASRALKNEKGSDWSWGEI